MTFRECGDRPRNWRGRLDPFLTCDLPAGHAGDHSKTATQWTRYAWDNTRDAAVHTVWDDLSGPDPTQDTIEG